MYSTELCICSTYTQYVCGCFLSCEGARKLWSGSSGTKNYITSVYDPFTFSTSHSRTVYIVRLSFIAAVTAEGNTFVGTKQNKGLTSPDSCREMFAFPKSDLDSWRGVAPGRTGLNLQWYTYTGARNVLLRCKIGAQRGMMPCTWPS